MILSGLNSASEAITSKIQGVVDDSQTSKAKLIFYYPRSTKTQVKYVKKGNGNSGTYFNKGSSSQTFAGIGDSLISKNTITSISTASVDDFGDFKGVKSATTTLGEAFEMKFQYNPSNISISAYGGGMRQILDFGAGENESDSDAVDGDANGNNHKTSGIRYASMAPNISLSFSTIFDATKNSDAFVSDKINLNLTNVAKNIASLVSEETYSVRAVVEGLMEAVRAPDKRNVRFVWGDMDYQGLLNSVNARYTLFNTKGEPIRAQVHFSMMVPLESSITASDFWKDRYDEIVGRNSGDYITVANSSVSSIANSLLNLQN